MGIQCLVDLVQYQNMEIFKILVLLLILAYGNLACLVRKTKVFQPPKPSKFDRNVHISEVNLPKKEKKSSEHRSFENIWKPLYASNKIIEDFQEFDEPEIITVENIHKYRETRPTSFNLSKILKATMMVGEI